MDNLLKKIVSIIDDNISNYKIEIKQLETSELYELYDELNKFINDYNTNNKINFSLLETFIDKMDFPNKLSIEDYKNIINLIEKLKENSAFSEFINGANKIIAFLIEGIKLYINELLKQIDELNKNKEIINDNIIDDKKALEILTKIINKELISNEDYNYIVNFIKDNKLPLSKEEKKLFVLNLTKNNSLLMKKIIDKRKRESRIKKLSPNQEEQEKVEESKPIINIIINLLSNHQISLYLRATKIIQKNYNLTGEEEAAINSLISSNTSIEERFLVYKEYIRDNNLKDLIIRDIEVNILPKINENAENNIIDDNLFNILNSLLNELEQLDEKDKFSYIDFLEKINNEEAIQLLKKINILLDNCNNACENDKTIKGTLGTTMKDLTMLLSNYINALKEYRFSPSENNESLVTNIYKEMNEKYNELLELYTTAFIEKEVKKTIEEQYFDNAMKFYNECDVIRNIIIFVDGSDEVTPIIEEDIEKDRKITNKAQAYRSVTGKLRQMIISNFASERGHTSKSDNYSIPFLKDFKIRSKNLGETRLLYGRFNTNLQTFFPNLKENPHVLLISKVGYGDTDGAVKKELNETAIKRCYDKKEKLIEIQKMLQTNAEELNEQEREKVRQQITEFLTSQNIRLGHFISHLPEYKVNSMGEGGNKK